MKSRASRFTLLAVGLGILIATPSAFSQDGVPADQTELPLKGQPDGVPPENPPDDVPPGDVPPGDVPPDHANAADDGDGGDGGALGECGTKLEVGSAAGRAGQRVQVTLIGQSRCQVEGFSLAIGHDPATVKFVEAAPGPFIVNAVGPGLLFNFAPDELEGFTSGVAIFLDEADPSKTVSTTIPPGTPLATLTYEISADATLGTTVVLLNENRRFGDPLVDHVFVSGSETLAPVLKSGSITVGEQQHGGDGGDGGHGKPDDVPRGDGKPDDAGKPDHAGKPDDAGKPDGAGKPIQARTQLVRPDPPVDDDANGDVRLREHKDRSSIHVHVRHLDQGVVYSVDISAGDESENLGSITIISDDDDGDPSPQQRCFEASLSGDQEVPAVETDATGMAHVQLTGRNGTTLRYQVLVKGLSGPAIGAHIHMAPAGENGEVVHPLDEATLRGSIEITEEEAAALATGDFYVNVHTELNPGGEIRGQLAACVDDDGDGGDGDPDPSGNGKLRIDTARGDSLPLGAESVADLVGTTVTVSDPDGNVVISGDIVDLKMHKFGKGRQGPKDDADGGDVVAGVLNIVMETEPDPIFDEFLFDVYGRHDASFIRGDGNEDGEVDIADAVKGLFILFQGVPLPYCADAADANDDGEHDISDPISILGSLFLGHGALPSPGAFEGSGFDRSADYLFCVNYE